MVEVLLPNGYRRGNKVTDAHISLLYRIYGEVTTVNYPTGTADHLIILNSFEEHSEDILYAYKPEQTWYYMYDMNWGLGFYLKHKDKMQLITDKEFEGSRIVIPYTKFRLNSFDIGEPKGTKRLCVMESYKEERFNQYDKWLNNPGIAMDVIGKTMNNNYMHPHTKVDSVPYKFLNSLLSEYMFCLILWDKYHSKDLPVKVVECMEAGCIPILVGEYDHPIFPTVNSIPELITTMNELEGSQEEVLISISNHYNGYLPFSDIKRGAQLIETDYLMLKEIEEVLVWGRDKHRGHYWRDNLDVKDFRQALQRHLDAYDSGELLDKETGKSHLIHAACNIMFLRRIDESK